MNIYRDHIPHNHDSISSTKEIRMYQIPRKRLYDLHNIFSRTFSSNVPPALAPLQVLRIFFNLCIIIYHAGFYLAASLSSGAPADALINDFSSVPASIFQIVYFGFRYGVDVFLFISGFFMASKFVVPLQNGVTAGFIFRYLLLRWLRLAPMYIIVSLIQRLQGNAQCPNITEVLQIANIFSSAHDRCIIVGWSTIIDFQSHVIICILALLTRNTQRMKRTLLFFIVLSAFARLSYWYQTGFPAWPIMLTAQEAEDKDVLSVVHKLPVGSYDISRGTGALRRAGLLSYYPLYFDLRYRLAPCMIGFLCWLNMYEQGWFYRSVMKRRFLSAISAIMVISIDFGVLLNSHPDLASFSMIGSGFHEAFGSVIVLGGISVVVMISCNMAGYQESRKECSSTSTFSKYVKKGLVVSCIWARVLYGVYLGHPIVLRSMHWWGDEMNDENFTHLQILIRGLVLYLVAGLVGIVVCLVEEGFLEFRRCVAGTYG